MKLDLISEVINLSNGFHSLKSNDAILWTQNCAKRDVKNDDQKGHDLFLTLRRPNLSISEIKKSETQ